MNLARLGSILCFLSCVVPRFYTDKSNHVSVSDMKVPVKLSQETISEGHRGEREGQKVWMDTLNIWIYSAYVLIHV